MLLATRGAVIWSTVITLICDNACLLFRKHHQHSVAISYLLLQTSLINAAEVIPDIVVAQQHPSPTVAAIIR